MEKRTKRTNNDLQNTIQKTKYQATRTPLVLNSGATKGKQRTPLVLNSGATKGKQRTPLVMNSGATKGKQRTPLVLNSGATKGKQHLLHMCYSCYKQTQ